MIEKIIETKRMEVEQLRGRKRGERVRPLVPFTLKEGVNVIAELKRKSPSAGVIGKIDGERIDIYTRYASAISVLTDAVYFDGSFDILSNVVKRTPLPVLCKDFFIDKLQIDLAYEKGADLILLIVRILDGDKLFDLFNYASQLGISCLVEVHEKSELEKIAGLNAPIVGVNSRDLDTLDVDLARAKSILSLVKSPVRIAESGIRTRENIENLKEANCFLIGETLMRAGTSSELETTFRELLYG